VVSLWWTTYLLGNAVQIAVHARRLRRTSVEGALVWLRNRELDHAPG
jgi:hypothetical protein